MVVEDVILYLKNADKFICNFKYISGVDLTVIILFWCKNISKNFNDFNSEAITNEIINIFKYQHNEEPTNEEIERLNKKITDMIKKENQNEFKEIPNNTFNKIIYTFNTCYYLNLKANHPIMDDKDLKKLIIKLMLEAIAFLEIKKTTSYDVYKIIRETMKGIKNKCKCYKCLQKKKNIQI